MEDEQGWSRLVELVEQGVDIDKVIKEVKKDD